jgi:hypothetical protein
MDNHEFSLVMARAINEAAASVPAASVLDGGDTRRQWQAAATAAATFTGRPCRIESRHPFLYGGMIYIRSPLIEGCIGHWSDRDAPGVRLVMSASPTLIRDALGDCALPSVPGFSPQEIVLPDGRRAVPYRDVRDLAWLIEARAQWPQYRECFSVSPSGSIYIRLPNRRVRATIRIADHPAPTPRHDNHDLLLEAIMVDGRKYWISDLATIQERLADLLATAGHALAA